MDEKNHPHITHYCNDKSYYVHERVHNVLSIQVHYGLLNYFLLFEGRWKG